MFRSISSGLLYTLFSADGRIGRGDYWLWSILVNLAVLAVQHYIFGFWTLSPVFLDVLIARGDELPADVAVVHMVLFILTLWPVLCLSVKRWHDRERTGWIGFLILGVTYVVMLKDAVTTAPWDFYMFFVVAAVAGNLWQLVECGILDGTKGPNRYGPSPKGVGAAPDGF